MNGDAIMFSDERAVDYYGDECEHEFLWGAIADIRAEFDSFLIMMLNDEEKL